MTKPYVEDAVGRQVVRKTLSRAVLGSANAFGDKDPLMALFSLKYVYNP